MNIGGSYFPYNYLVSEEEADKRAIVCDWKMVGSDIHISAQEVNEGIQMKAGKQLEFEY